MPDLIVGRITQLSSVPFYVKRSLLKDDIYRIVDKKKKVLLKKFKHSLSNRGD